MNSLGIHLKKKELTMEFLTNLLQVLIGIMVGKVDGSSY